MPSKRRSAHEEHEEHVNHEAWVIPYADMVTLLMGLFVVMWAIGSADLAKLREVATSFATAVGMEAPGPMDGGPGVFDGTAAPPLPETPNSTFPMDPEQLRQAEEALNREAAASIAFQAEQQSLDQVEATIMSHAEATGTQSVISFRREARGLVVSIVTDDLLFAPGSASLRPEGLAVLQSVASALLELPNTISIEGHTDSIPISTAQFPSNWELSTSRASTVLRHLVDSYGVPADRIMASGYADMRPLGDNATAEGRAMNRRVDIAVLADFESTPAPTATEEGGSTEETSDGQEG